MGKNGRKYVEKNHSWEAIGRKTAEVCSKIIYNGSSMQPSKKFAFDIGITFIASVISILHGFIVTIFIGRYLGAGDLGLYYMNSTIYGITMLFAGIGIPAAMIKYVAQYRADRGNIQ